MTEKAAIDAALQANKDHQYALRVYIEQLESELKTVDKMIEGIDSDEDPEDVTENGLVFIEGAVRPVSVVLQRVLLSEDSPFYKDAQWRKRYEDYTTVNPMKVKEHEALREAVRTENMRIQTLETQSRNQTIDIQTFPREHFEQNTEGIDWRRVSVRMSSLIPSAVPRTPKECEIRWRGYLHPSINHDPWTPEESEKLQCLLAEDGPDKSTRNWVEIAKKLATNRTPLDCMRHGTTRRVHVWTPETDQKLLEAVEIYGQNNWQLVAMAVSEDATAHQCQKRYLDSLDPSLKNGPWTPEEHKQLERAIVAVAGQAAIDDEQKEAGGSKALGKQSSHIAWQDVALFVPGRTNNQCREHYQHQILKSRRKQKERGESTASGRKRSARGKEKAMASLEDSDYDEPEDASAGISEHEEERITNADTTKKRKSGTSVKAKAREKDDGQAAELAGNGESHAEQPTVRARPQPRPRRRKKQGSTEMEFVTEEVASVQPGPSTEETEAMPSQNKIPRDTEADSGQENGRRVSRKRGISRKRRTEIEDTHPLAPSQDEATHSVEGEPDVTVEEIPQNASTIPATKRPRTVGRSRRGNATASLAKTGTSSRVEREAITGGTDGSTGARSAISRSEDVEEVTSGRRRSARLETDKS